MAEGDEPSGDPAAEPARPAAEPVPVPSAASPEAANTSTNPAEAGAPLVALAAEPPKATIGADEVTQTWEERSRERKHELQALREKEKATLGAVQRRDAKERLAYLMKQTDVFAHFIKPDEAAGGGVGGGGGGGEKGKGEEKEGKAAGRRKKGRMTEKQEDELLLKAATPTPTPDAAYPYP